MRVFVLALILLFSEKHFAGCSFKLTSSNGVSIGTAAEQDPTTVDSVYINIVDSVDITINGHGCGVSMLSLSLEGESVHFGRVSESWGGAITIRILGLPGRYAFFFYIGGGAGRGYFDFIEKRPVGIPEISASDENLLVFPNPAKDEIQIDFKNLELKAAGLYNSLGQEIQHFQIQSPLLKISLSTYPAGIYFLQAATLSDKIIIKKIIVL